MTPEIILGPPGTGKTTTLLRLVEEELAGGTDPARVGYVSFTKQAANQAVERGTRLLGLTASQLPYFRTLHSLCFWALGLSPGDVLERNRLLEFGEWAGIRVTGRFSMEEGTSFGFEQGDRILFMENLARIRCVTLREQYDADDDNLPWNEVDRVSRALAEYKAARHLVDYTDMLTDVVQSGWQPHLQVLFVDEAQDLSQLQWRVVARLAAGTRRVVVAGDDDQAIYRWAGADVEHFVGMPGSARVLDRSWRVPRQVQAVSSEVIQRVQHRRDKVWHPRPEEGVVDRVRHVDQADLSGEEVLILARNTYILRDLVAPRLRASGVIFEMRGVSSVRPATLRAIVDWERLRRGDAVTVEEALGVYEHMSSGVGVARGHKRLPGWDPTVPVSLGDLMGRGGLLVDGIWHDSLDRIPAEERAYMLRALRAGERLRRTPRVRMSTIHGAKGSEARHVVLLTDMAPRTHAEMLQGGDDEGRVWYVAVTRAKEQLTIVQPGTSRYYDL